MAEHLLNNSSTAHSLDELASQSTENAEKRIKLEEYSSDDEETFKITMIQCELCEDWYHTSCLSKISDIPDDSLFDQYFCMLCIEDSEFLKLNSHLMSFDGHKTHENFNLCFGTKKETKLGISKVGLFTNNIWKDAVCKCDICIENLKKDPMHILLLEDCPNWKPLEEFTQQDSNKDENDWEVLTESLNKIDRVAAINGINACNAFKDSIKHFLKPFASNNKVVTKQVSVT